MSRVSSFDLSLHEKIVENALDEDREDLSMGDCTMSDTDARIAVRALADANALKITITANEIEKAAKVLFGIDDNQATMGSWHDLEPEIKRFYLNTSAAMLTATFEGS